MTFAKSDHCMCCWPSDFGNPSKCEDCVACHGSSPTQEELDRLPYLSPEQRIYGRFVLPPCKQTTGPWWDRQHDYCTGGHHLGPGILYVCSCDCHVGEQVLIKPRPLTHPASAR